MNQIFAMINYSLSTIWRCTHCYISGGYCLLYNSNGSLILHLFLGSLCWPFYKLVGWRAHESHWSTCLYWMLFVKAVGIPLCLKPLWFYCVEICCVANKVSHSFLLSYAFSCLFFLFVLSSLNMWIYYSIILFSAEICNLKKRVS